MTIDKQLLKNALSGKKDVALKKITDLVAYKIYESQENLGEKANYLAAIDAIVQYLSENLPDIHSFRGKLSQLNKGTLSVHRFADIIYEYYRENHFLDFEVVKNLISTAKDADLKKITDIVAFKIYQSPEDKGPELNFLSAETFVAHYVSENFKNIPAFKEYLATLGKGDAALETFAQIVYYYYYRNENEQSCANE
ncbi:MAG: hypothetical protein A2W17_10625 [Planctomycetes bacterium RBG_16_41_13]|nr:MAG: hypothetical protein A2W17_10625 [Planctomycetes bacterium RBG_16_41_13]